MTNTVLGWRKSSLKLFLFLIFYLFYLILGASIFSAIEAPQEKTLVKELRTFRDQFLSKHQCVSDSSLEQLIRHIVRANNNGVSAVRNATMEPNWSFGQSFFFAGTIITTIGYGHVSPLSDSGKGFCIAYAMAGIPLTLILITALVERLMCVTTVLLQLLNSRLGHLYQPFNIRLAHLIIVAIIVFSFMLLVPAAIFSTLEPNWNYLDAFYYCFISLTTIGLGDYIPGDSPDQTNRAVYKVVTTFYLLVGLTFMMLTLTLLYDIPQLNFGAHFLLASDERHAEAERLRLKTAAAASGPQYTQHMDEVLPMETPSPETPERR